MDYDNELDAHNEFYSNFDNIATPETVEEIYNDKIVDCAEENDWEDSDEEYENEKEWYKYNKEDVDYQAEKETVETIIERVFEDTDINPFRLDGDDYTDFENYVKEKYTFLDDEIED